MGTVFLAKDEQLDRQVALKFPRGNLQQGGEQQTRFLREARAAAALHHANICPIYDAGEIQGINFICMGYVDGSPLSQFAVLDSGLTEQQIARIILQVAKAVAAAHSAGFIHRDLKPANIMIDLNNEPVILDFGLARRINRSDDQRVTQAGAIMGSPCYMSPEQVDGDEQRVGPQADIYSLGVILYELLTGRVPFEGSFASVMGQIMTKTPDKPSAYRKNLSVRLETICNKMMAKQQDQRFSSMAAVADALQEYLDKFDDPNPVTSDDAANETTPISKGEQRKQHIEQLIKASDYGPAETLLVSLSRETSDALQQYAVWAAAELPKLRKLREKVRTGRQDIYETATRLMKTCDYEQVVRLLADYPYDIRTPNMQQLLEKAERLSNEVERLAKGIAAARTRGANELLMRLLQEKLKLKPQDREAKELYDQLFRRSEGPISKVLGGNTPRSVRSIPAVIQWLLIFALVVPMCAVPAYMWAQGYLARKSENSDLAVPFNQQEVVTMDDAEPKVNQPPESIASVEDDSQPVQAPPVAIAPFDVAQAKAHQKAWADHLGVPVETTNSIGMKLVVIPAGEYTMGSPASEAGRQPPNTLDETQHRVKLSSSFLLGVYEVTQSQYESVMGSNPSHFKGPDNPVETISWDDAVAFCRKLSDLPAEKSAGRVYRLPTEAEWEYACRAGTMTEFSFGDDAKGLGDYAWFHDNSGSTTHAVGGKLPNGWGLYGMHGNVWEWCSDEVDLSSDAEGSYRVSRGGGWGSDAANCRTALRGTNDPSFRDYSLGFRLALSSPSVQSPEAENTASPKPNQAPPAEFTPIDTAAAKADQVPPAAIAPFDAAQAKAHQKAWSDHLEVPVESTNSIGMKLVLIPPGEFMMGSPESEPDRAPDETSHKVTLTQPFQIGTYEVTQTQYEEVIGSNPSFFKGPDNPVETISWDDAVAFCRKLSDLPAEKSAGRVYRLPTEAEWEHACRAGTTTAFSFGDNPKDLGKYAWFGDNSGEILIDSAALWASDSETYHEKLSANKCITHGVGQKKPNAWGLYDMHGNVWERCQDWYGGYPSDSVVNPMGPASGSHRMFRGGGWNSFSDLCRSARRDGYTPDDRHASVGFRVLRSSVKLSSEAEVTSSFGLPIGKRKTIHNLIHIPSGGPGTDLRWISVDVKEAETLTTQGYWKTRSVLGFGTIDEETDTLPLWRFLSASDNQYHYFLDKPKKGQRTQNLLAWVWTKRLPGMIEVFVLDNGGNIMQLVSETDKADGGSRRDWLVNEQHWRQRFTFYVYPPSD